MNVNDPAHLTDELPERLLASDDIETQRLLRLAGVSELYCSCLLYTSPSPRDS